MRIVHVSDAFTPRMGGIEAQVGRLAGRQALAGHDVEVITTTPGTPGGHGVSTGVERCSGGEVTVHRIAARVPGGWPVHPRSTAHVVRRLRERIARGRRPDVVHLHMGVLAPTVHGALRPVVRLGLPAVLTVHSVWGGAWRGFAAADRLAGWSRWPVLWSAVSELTAAPLRRIVGGHGEVVVLPNGIDLDAWRGDGVPGGGCGDRVPDASTACEPRPVHLVSAARFAPRKRMMPLLGAIAAARDALPGRGRDSLRATLAGAGTDLDRARRFVVGHGLSGVVSLPGVLGADGLRSLYARADVFVAPGVAEAFGIAALEARAAGLPVLTRAGSGVAERVTDGVDGLIVADDDELARALVRLAGDAAARHELRRSTTDARSGLAPYDWPGVLAATERAYGRAAALVPRR